MLLGFKYLKVSTCLSSFSSLFIGFSPKSQLSRVLISFPHEHLSLNKSVHRLFGYICSVFVVDVHKILLRRSILNHQFNIKNNNFAEYNAISHIHCTPYTRWMIIHPQHDSSTSELTELSSVKNYNR